MAIRFLNALNIDGTITATINQDANAGYDGILVSTSGLIERRTKAQILADIGAGTGSMDNFVAAASAGSNSTIGNGDTLTIAAGTGVSTTNNGSGTITITATGSSYSGWELAGDSGSAQDISSGNTATFAGGDVISTVASATDTLTINHDAVSRTDTTSSASPGYGGTVDVVNTVSTTSEGHVTAIDLQTITFPAAENYTWTLAGDSGSGQTISSGDSATFQGGSAIVTEAKNTDTLEISLDIDGLTGATVAGGDLVAIADVNDSNNIKKVTAQSIADLAPQGDITAVQASTGQSEEGIKVTSSTGPIPKVGLDIQGQTNIGSGNLADEDEFIVHDKSVTKNLAVTYKTLKDQINLSAGTMSSFTLAGSSGTNQTISDGDTVTLAQGTGITTVGSNTDTVTITNSLPFNSITLAASTGSNSTITNTGTITIAAGSNISTTNNGSGTVTVAYTGGTGSMSSWTLSDGSNTQTIDDGNTVTVSGEATSSADAGITAVVSSTDNLTLKLDLEQVDNITALDDPDSDELIYFDSNNEINQRIAVSNIHLQEFGAPTSALSIGFQKLTNVATGVAGSDGVNLSQVQTIAAGVGTFKGGYDASTNPGSPVLSGGSNIALDQGDFFVVTTAGTFFTETVEVGDLIFANSSISASSSPSLSDYTVVIADQNIAGAGATDNATQKGVAGFDSGNFGVTANGFVTLDDVATAATKGGANKSLSATITAKGLVTSLSEQTIDITASQVSDFCSAVSTCIAANEQYTENIGGATSIEVTHNLNTRDVMVQLYDNSSYDTVYADVTRNTVNKVTVDFTSAPSANDIRILITKVA